MIFFFFFGPYLYKLHHGDRVEEVKPAKSVQSVGGAGDVGDGQGGGVAGKDGVSKEQSAEKQTVSNTSIVFQCFYKRITEVEARFR